MSMRIALAQINPVVGDLPGLFLTGAGLHGTGLPDSIADGQRAAFAADAHVTARSIPARRSGCVA